MDKLQKLDLNGTNFKVVYIPVGCKCPNHKITYQKDLVKFYDNRYKNPRFTPDGQFITGYYAETLLEKDIKGTFILDGGIPNWKIPEKPMQECLKWIKNIYEEYSVTKGVRITSGNVVYVSGVPADIMDTIEKCVNTEATGDGIVYVNWEEMVIWSEDYADAQGFETETDKKLGRFIYNIEQKIDTEVATVCFCK